MDAAKKKRKVLTAIAKRRRGWKTARNHATNPAGRPTSFPSSSRSREEGGEGGAPGAGAAPGGGTSTPTTSSAVSSEESSSAAAADSTGVASVAESASGAFLAPGCLSSEEEEDARAATRAPRVARTRRPRGSQTPSRISAGAATRATPRMASRRAKERGPRARVGLGLTRRETSRRIAPATGAARARGAAPRRTRRSNDAVATFVVSAQPRIAACIPARPEVGPLARALVPTRGARLGCLASGTCGRPEKRRSGVRGGAGCVRRRPREGASALEDPPRHSREKKRRSRASLARASRSASGRGRRLMAS